MYRCTSKYINLSCTVTLFTITRHTHVRVHMRVCNRTHTHTLSLSNLLSLSLPQSTTVHSTKYLVVTSAKGGEGGNTPTHQPPPSPLPSLSQTSN